MRKFFAPLALLAGFVIAMALPAAAQAVAAAPPVPGAGIFGALWPIVLSAAPVLVPVLGGPLNALVTEMLHRMPAVPFNKESTAGLIAVLTALSLATTLACDFGIAWLTGNAATFDVAHAGQVAAQIAASVMTAAGAFGLVKKATT